MPTSHTYRLLKGASWGIAITLRGDILTATDVSPDAVKVTDRIWMQVEVGWSLSKEQVDLLKRGLVLVADDIERTVRSETPILVCLTSLEYNPTDYQPEGLVAAVMEWAARAGGFPTPQISSSFDQSRRRYMFDFPNEAADASEDHEMRTRIEFTVAPTVWVVELVLAVSRRFWDDARIQPIGSTHIKPLRDNLVLGSKPVTDFLITHGPNRGTDDSTAHPQSNRRLRFRVAESSIAGTQSQVLTLYCDERTTEIERFGRRLEQTLWANWQSN